MGEFFDPFNTLGLRADAPKQRKYASELEQTLQAQIGLADDVFGAESNQQYGQPAYARLALENLGILLPGASDLYNQAASQTRASAMQDYRNLNPAQASLLDDLNRSAGLQLAAGATLRPEDAASITRSVRSDWASRGLGASAPAQLDEALQLYGGGENLRQMRQRFAGDVVQLNDATYGDVFDKAGVAALAHGQIIGPMWQNLGPLFNPESQYAGDLNNQRYQTQAAINAGNAANNAAIWSSIIGAAGGAAGACWSAREIFGEDDPRWMQFRNWVLFDAPSKFRQWYLENGEKWARRLKYATRSTRAAVKRWMLKRI